MFEKLTSREKKLVYATAGLVPLAIVFAAIFWFIGQLEKKNSQIETLLTSIQIEEDTAYDAARAKRRRDFYGSISLPPNSFDAGNDYQLWLKSTLIELGMYEKVIPASYTAIKYQNKQIGKGMNFNVEARCDYNQLIKFLEKFNSVDLLHRINLIKITPENDMGRNDKKIRNGRLAVTLKIQALSLEIGEERTEFTNAVFDLARTSEDYESAILRRNIFGPANNIPVLSVSSRSSTSDATVSISARDADEQDLLKFEIVESAIEDFELKQSRPEDRRVQLKIPYQEPGKYDFKVQVTDNGFPPKVSVKDFSVTFKEKPAPRVTKREDPPPPAPFIRAQTTKITGIVRLITGDWQVWIIEGTTGEKFFLTEGESFKLDKMDWMVSSIQFDRVDIQVDGKILSFVEGDFLNQPRSKVSVPTENTTSQSTKESNSETST